MNKQEIINDGYKISAGGIIKNSGKFEGCHWAAISFYDLMMNGVSDETLWDDPELVEVFFIDVKDRADYDLADDTYAITLYENESGFIYFSEWDHRAYEALVARFEDLSTEERTN